MGAVVKVGETCEQTSAPDMGEVVHIEKIVQQTSAPEMGGLETEWTGIGTTTRST